MEKTLDPIYSAFLSFCLSLWLPEEHEHQQGGASAGMGKHTGAFSSLLLFLQVLGALFLAIGLWAWSEKVRQRDVVQGYYGLRWWDGQSPPPASVPPAQGVLSNISALTDLGGLDPVWLFVVVGGIMSVLGFAGCIGALRENTFLLKFVSALPPGFTGDPNLLPPTSYI